MPSLGAGKALELGHEQQEGTKEQVRHKLAPLGAQVQGAAEALLRRRDGALGGLHLAVEGAVGLADLGDPDAEQPVVAVDRVAVEARQGGRRERRHVGAEESQQLPELAL